MWPRAWTRVEEGVEESAESAGVPTWYEVLESK